MNVSMEWKQSNENEIERTKLRCEFDASPRMEVNAVAICNLKLQKREFCELLSLYSGS